MLGSRITRIAAAIFVLSAVFHLLWPRATGYVSTFAVINAPVQTVRAPVNGIVTLPTPAVATPVSRDQVVFGLRATFTDRAEHARLIGDRLARLEQLAALDDEIARTRATIAALDARAETETEEEVAYLQEKLREERAYGEMHTAQRDRQDLRISTLEALTARGTAAARDLADARLARREVSAQIAASDARIQALSIEIAAITAARPSPGGSGRRQAALDRRTDLELLVSDLTTRRALIAAEVKGAEAALAAMDRQLDETDSFRPVAASDSVIWTASRPEGSSVTLGSDLYQTLDCSRRFLEVIFNETAFDMVRPGTKATVRLRGASDSFETTVISRHAAAGGSARSAVDTAIGEPYEQGGVKVFLALDPVDPSEEGVAQAFCDIGRTAEVVVRDPRFLSLLETAAAQIDAIRRQVRDRRIVAALDHVQSFFQ